MSNSYTFCSFSGPGLSKLYSDLEVLLISHSGLEGVLGVVDEAGVTEPPVRIRGASLDVLVNEFLGLVNELMGEAKLSESGTKYKVSQQVLAKIPKLS